MLSGIGVSGQEKLKKSKIIVIGAGGMGSSALQYLAASGIGELGICDNTAIEEEHFQHQVLYNSLDLGKQKAIIAKQKLEGLNSLNNYSIFNIFLSSENALNICRNFEIVIDATNDQQIGLILDEVCFHQQIPLIYAERNQHECKIAVFNYLKGPRMLDFTKSKFNNPLNLNEIDHFGSFGVIDGIIGNLMATEAIKIVTGMGKVLCDRYCLIDPVNLIIEYKNLN
jgi:adenylyltransferase/sulfurtransferase